VVLTAVVAPPTRPGQSTPVVPIIAVGPGDADQRQIAGGIAVDEIGNSARGGPRIVDMQPRHVRIRILFGDDADRPALHRIPGVAESILLMPADRNEQFSRSAQPGVLLHSCDKEVLSFVVGVLDDCSHRLGHAAQCPCLRAHR
jgi:hypothetical protein